MRANAGLSRNNVSLLLRSFTVSLNSVVGGYKSRLNFSTMSPVMFGSSTNVSKSVFNNCGCNIYLKTSVNNRFFTTTQAANQVAKRKPSSSQSHSLTESKDAGGQVTLSMGEKVKENAKTATYGGVIILGVAVSGAMLYVLLSELFSSNSPNNIYTHSFKLCKLSMEVQDAIGTPIKCYGEETRRGWRRHVAHSEFLQDNTKYLRMRYYIEGPFRKATVHVEKKMNDRGSYEYDYVIVDVDGYPPRRINVHF